MYSLWTSEPEREVDLFLPVQSLVRFKSSLSSGSGCCIQITELCDGIIRVHAPLHAKVSMAIQLDEQMTAKDIMSRFESDTR